MHQSAAVVIVGPTVLFRQTLARKLFPTACRIVASKEALSDLKWEQLPRSEHYFIVVECSESPQSLAAEVAKIKQRNPLTRVVLLGHHWSAADIAMAFEAGVSAYFAEATISKEFLQTIKRFTW
jgi:DNA-binding NarL/FixJ family response regulator